MPALAIKQISSDPRKRTQQLTQALEMLDLYQAELARILHLRCADIAHLCNAQTLLDSTTPAWYRARQFLRLYQLLHQKFRGEGVQMRHWIRRHHEHFDQTPHLMLVDEGRLDELVDWLQQTSEKLP